MVIFAVPSYLGSKDYYFWKKNAKKDDAHLPHKRLYMTGSHVGK